MTNPTFPVKRTHPFGEHEWLTCDHDRYYLTNSDADRAIASSDWWNNGSPINMTWLINAYKANCCSSRWAIHIPHMPGYPKLLPLAHQTICRRCSEAASFFPREIPPDSVWLDNWQPGKYIDNGKIESSFPMFTHVFSDSKILQLTNWAIDATQTEISRRDPSMRLESPMGREMSNVRFRVLPSVLRLDYADVPNMVRCIIGNPFRPITTQGGHLVINDEDATPTARTINIARRIYQENDYSDLTALTDALIEDGCNNKQIIEHLQSKHRHHRGCHIIDRIFGIRDDPIGLHWGPSRLLDTWYRTAYSILRQS